MKKLTFLTCAILIAPTAYAATKCVPLDVKKVTCTDMQDKNPYFFSWNANCTYDNNQIVVGGISLCFSKAGSKIYEHTRSLLYASDTTSQFRYCWCQLTQPALSEYLYVKEFSSQVECVRDCSITCEKLTYSTDMPSLLGRTTLFDNLISD